MRRLWLAAVLLGGCVIPSMIETHENGRGRGGTVSYRGRNLRADILETRRADALELASRFCDGGSFFHVTEWQDGFNENFVEFRCGDAVDGGE